MTYDEMQNLLGQFGGGTGTANQAVAGIGKGATTIAPFTGPAAPFVAGGGTLLSLLGSLGLFDSGLPTTAKTQALATGLEGGGDPLGQLVGQYMATGANQGHPISDPKFGSAIQAFAGILQDLTGQKINPLTVQGNGQFDNPVSFGTVGNLGQQTPGIPPGYEFLQETPANLQTVFKLLSQQIPFGGLGNRQGFDNEWSKIVQQLIQSGALQKYTGPLGAPTPATASTNPITGVPASPTTTQALPHPFTSNAVMSPLPYPV